MENQNNNLIENFVKKLCSKKERLIGFISSCLAVIFSLVYLLKGNFGAVMMFYMLFILFSNAGLLLYFLDVDESNKYTKDILAASVASAVVATLIRVIQLGILFSIQYFIFYVLFCISFILTLKKISHNKGKESFIVLLFSILSVYNVEEIIRISSLTTFGGLSWTYFRIAEILLAITIIISIIINKGRFAELSDNLGFYKNQIPSLKIILIIFTFVTVLSLSTGFISKLTDKNTVSSTKTTSVTTINKSEPTKNKSKGTVSSSNETSNSVTQDSTKEIKINETISTDDYDFTLNNVSFSYKVVPANPPSYYTYYDAPNDQVYIYINATVKNKKKQSVRCDEIYSVSVEYDDGYTYTGFNIADDTDGDFTYANITSVEPLQSLGVHCLVACPEEVETSDGKVVLTFNLKDGSKFKFNMR